MIFDTKSLREAVSAQAPPGARNAFVFTGTTDGAVSGVLMTKLGRHWKMDSLLSYDKEHGFEGGVQVVATW